MNATPVDAASGAVYPVGLRLLDRRVGVVGGGQVAHRRGAGLLDARARGTGALLALPLVASAARALRDVATFDSAGVTEKG